MAKATLGALYKAILENWPLQECAHCFSEVKEDPKMIHTYAAKHISGDTLLDFVLLEAHDTCSDTVQPVLNALDNAVDDLKAMRKALEDEFK